MKHTILCRCVDVLFSIWIQTHRTDVDAVEKKRSTSKQSQRYQRSRLSADRPSIIMKKSRLGLALSQFAIHIAINLNFTQKKHNHIDGGSDGSSSRTTVHSVS